MEKIVEYSLEEYDHILEAHTSSSSKFNPPKFMQPFLVRYMSLKQTPPSYFDDFIGWPLLRATDFVQTAEIVKKAKVGCQRMLREDKTLTRDLRALVEEKLSAAEELIKVYDAIEKLISEYCPELMTELL